MILKLESSIDSIMKKSKEYLLFSTNRVERADETARKFKRCKRFVENSIIIGWSSGIRNGGIENTALRFV